MDLHGHGHGPPLLHLTTDQGQLAFSDTGGAGPCLLFLHGAGCDSEDWRATADCLPASLRLITLDFRGHGGSSVPSSRFSIHDLAGDVIHFLRARAVDAVVLAGHSLGGMVAMDVAACSSAVKALVLVEGWTSLRAAAALGPDRFFGSLTTGVIEKIRNKSERTRARFAPEIWQAFWESVVQYDASAYLERAAIPIFEVYGEMGRGPDTERLLLVPANPSVRWVWMAHSGHYLPIERPTEMAAVCLSAVRAVHGTL